MSESLVAELRRRGVADVDDSTLTRAMYSSDASLYRVVPQVVARPRAGDDLVAGATQQQRLLATAPKTPTEEDLAQVFVASMEHW